MRWIMWYCGIYIIIYRSVQNRDEHFTHNNHLDISSWYPHYGWLLLVKFSLLFLNTSDRYCEISHCILYLHYITTLYIYIYFLFFLNVGSAIFVRWSRAKTLMVQRSFLPAEDWRTSTMILLLKTTFRLIKKTKTFRCQSQSSCLNHMFPYFSQFLSKILGITKFLPVLFPCIFCRLWGHLGSDSIGNGSGGNTEKLLGQFMDVLLVINGEISFFLLILGTIFRHRTLPDGFNPYENFTNRTCG